MYKLDFCLVPFFYLFRMNFSILSLALFLALYFPKIVTKALHNTASLAKSFKSALTTHVKLSDKEAEFIMKNIEMENE